MNNDVSFEEVFDIQQSFQIEIYGGENQQTPSKVFYHVSNAMIELSETLQKDQRWKDHKRTAQSAPLDDIAEEFADSFLYMVNGMLSAGIDSERFQKAITKSINKNFKRERDGY